MLHSRSCKTSCFRPAIGGGLAVLVTLRHLGRRERMRPATMGRQAAIGCGKACRAHNDWPLILIPIPAFNALAAPIAHPNARMIK